MALIEKAVGTATVVRATPPPKKETTPAPAPRPTRILDEDRPAPVRPAVSPEAVPKVLASRGKEEVLLGSIKTSDAPVSRVGTVGMGSSPLKTALQLYGPTMMGSAGNAGNAGNAGSAGFAGASGSGSTQPVGDVELSRRVEQAAGTDAARLGADYRAQTKPQIVTVEGVDIPVYGVRNQQELDQISRTLGNTKGIGPEALAAVDQINLYDKGRFKSDKGDEIPGFYQDEQIYVNRQQQFPNLNHEFGHLVDDLVGGQKKGKFGQGPFLNGDNYNAAEDFAINFDYVTSGTVEGLRPGVVSDPVAQEKMKATREAWNEFRQLYPDGERLETPGVSAVSSAARKVVGLLGF